MAPRFDLIGMVVADMAATLAFYRRLGLDIPSDADDQPHVETTVQGVRLAWDTVATVHSFDAEWAAPKGGHRMSLAFVCDGPAEVDSVHADLVAAGYRSHQDPWDAFWGQRYATVLDPDDNPVDLFAWLPK
ncbi:MAG TPA: VOC family protein [Pseudonocardiaceae bacterium]|nr:VOC family protein [Pseudonocardiaceae bacterium]